MKKVGLNINSEKDIDGTYQQRLVKAITNTFENCEIFIFHDSQIPDHSVLDNMDMLITLGGDGTIIRTARALCNYEIPIIGINIGNLGFLASVEIEDVENALRDIKNKHYTVEQRMMIACSVENEGKEKIFHSLNDVVIAKGALARMARYKILVNDRLFTNFSADGVIISTPTGSTAYALSAGGPIINPDLNLIEITPICSQTQGLRTLILDSKSKITIKLKILNEGIYLTVDGQESVKLNDDSIINIGYSNHKTKLIRLNSYDYYKVLREKIIWRTRECEGE